MALRELINKYLLNRNAPQPGLLGGEEASLRPDEAILGGSNAKLSPAAPPEPAQASMIPAPNIGKAVSDYLRPKFSDFPKSDFSVGVSNSTATAQSPGPDVKQDPQFKLKSVLPDPKFDLLAGLDKKPDETKPAPAETPAPKKQMKPAAPSTPETKPAIDETNDTETIKKAASSGRWDLAFAALAGLGDAITGAYGTGTPTRGLDNVMAEIRQRAAAAEERRQRDEDVARSDKRFSAELTEKEKDRALKREELDLKREEKANKRAKVGAAQKSEIVEIKSQILNVGSMRKQLENLWSGPVAGGVATLTGKGTQGLMASGNKVYTDLRPAMSAGLYRSVTGDKRLSDQDAGARALPMIPAPWESRTVQNKKWDVIEKLLGERLKIVQSLPDGSEIPDTPELLSMAYTELGITPEDQAAIDWARENEDDPRAQQILELNNGRF